jgi:hypothetical protein
MQFTVTATSMKGVNRLARGGAKVLTRTDTGRSSFHVIAAFLSIPLSSVPLSCTLALKLPSARAPFSHEANAQGGCHRQDAGRDGHT